VRKVGGVVIPRASVDEPADRGSVIAASPNLTVREGTTALVLLATLAVVSLLANAPLADPANPGLSPNPAKAPWYFMGFQELLIHFHPLFAVLVFPLLAVVFLVRAAKWTSSPAEGVWFASQRGRRLSVAASAAGAALTALAVILDESLPDLAKTLPAVPRVVTTGIVPFALTTAVAWNVMFWMRRRFSSSPEDTGPAWFAGLTASFVMLTLIGVFFRGEGMALRWPW
jgi:hypothetical protein